MLERLGVECTLSRAPNVMCDEVSELDVTVWWTLSRRLGTVGDM